MYRSSFSSEFKVLEKLGEGSFAEVFKVKSTRNNGSSLFAIKRLKKRFHSVDEVNRLTEITTCQLLQGHPNVVRLFDVLYDSTHGYVALVFELLDCNLYEYVKGRGRPCDERQSLLFIYQLLKAISYLHSKNIFHRDVKPENCMVNKNTLELKLVDFGSCRVDDHGGNFDNFYTEYVSTRWYRAPECILTSGLYGKAVDIWAVGCMLYELLTTRPLFPGKHELDQISRIHQVVGSPSREVLSQFKRNPNTQISFSFPSKQPQDLNRLLPNVSKSTVDLLKKLLIYDPRDRITADEALMHPAFDIYVVLDKKWRETGEIVPYSVFFTAQIAQVSKHNGAFTTILHPKNNMTENQVDSTKANTYSNSKDFYNQNLNDYLVAHPFEEPEKPPKKQSNIFGNQKQYGNVQYSNNSVNYKVHEPAQVSKGPQPSHLYENLHNNSQQQEQGNKPDYNSSAMLKEARLRAAQRIREYNKKKYGINAVNKLKIQPPPPKQPQEPQFTQLPQEQSIQIAPPLIKKNKNNYVEKNYNNAKIQQPTIYQKPAPEIVQPRVPKNRHIYKAPPM